MTLDVKKVTVQMLSNCQYRKTGPELQKRHFEQARVGKLSEWLFRYSLDML
jgi:hypothetical protein